MSGALGGAMSWGEGAFWLVVLVGGGCAFILGIAALEVWIAVLWVGLRLLIRAEVAAAQGLLRFCAWIGARRERAR